MLVPEELPEFAASAESRRQCISSPCPCGFPTPSPSAEWTSPEAWPAARPSISPVAGTSASARCQRLPARTEQFTSVVYRENLGIYGNSWGKFCPFSPAQTPHPIHAASALTIGKIVPARQPLPDWSQLFPGRTGPPGINADGPAYRIHIAVARVSDAGGDDRGTRTSGTRSRNEEAGRTGRRGRKGSSGSTLKILADAITAIGLTLILTACKQRVLTALNSGGKQGPAGWRGRYPSTCARFSTGLRPMGDGQYSVLATVLDDYGAEGLVSARYSGSGQGGGWSAWRTPCPARGR